MRTMILCCIYGKKDTWAYTPERSTSAALTKPKPISGFWTSTASPLRTCEPSAKAAANKKKPEKKNPVFFYSLPGKSSSENSHRLPPRNSLKTLVLIRVWAVFVLSIGLACNIITVLLCTHYTIFSKNCRSLGECFPLEPLFRCVATVGDLFPEPLRPCDFWNKNHKVFREPPSCQTSALCELKSCTPIRM